MYQYIPGVQHECKTPNDHQGVVGTIWKCENKIHKDGRYFILRAKYAYEDPYVDTYYWQRISKRKARRTVAKYRKRGL